MNPTIKKLLQLLQGGAQDFFPATSRVVNKSYRSTKALLGDQEEKKKLLQSGDLDLGKMNTDNQKAMAEALSYAVPFGKGKNFLTKYLLPGGAVGGLNTLTKDKTDPITAAKDIAGGMGGAAVLGGAAKVLGGVGRTLTKKLPERLMESAFKEPLKDTRAAIKGGESLGKQALQRGIKGMSDKGIYEASVSKMNTLEDALQEALSKSKRIVPLADIKKTVSPLVDKYNKTGNLSAVNEITNRISALEKYHGKAIPVSVANEVKRALYEEARNGYGKLASESTEAIKTIARGLKESIAKKVPGADQINKELSFEGRLADSVIDKIAKGGRNNMLGLTDAIISTGGGPVGIGAVVAKKVLGSTAGKTGIANTLNYVGKMGEKIPNIEDGMGQLAARLPSIFARPQANSDNGNQKNSQYQNSMKNISNSVIKQPNINQPQSQMQEQIDPNEEITLLDGTKATYGQLQEKGTFQQAQEPGTEQPPITDEQFKQAFIMDLMQTGGKNLDKLSKLQQLISPQEDIDTQIKKAQLQKLEKELSGTTKKPMAAVTENRVQLAESGLRAFKEIEKLLKNDPNKVLKAAIPGKLGARDYDSAAFRSVEGLLRARSGAAVPDYEVRRYMDANLPKIGDSEDEIKFKMAAFKKDLEAVAASGGGSSTGEEELLQMLQSLQQ